MGEVPTNTGEKKVFEALGRQLDDTWLMTSSYRYVELPGVKFIDREIDLLLAHPRYGLVLIEVKGGQLKRDAEKGWMQWEENSNAYQPTKAFRQIHNAKRGLEKFFKDHGLLNGKFLPIALYVAFVDVKRPHEKSAPSEEPLLVFGREVDALLQRIQKDVARKSEDIFDLKTVGNILFPNIEPQVYRPKPVVDISGLEASLSEIKEKIGTILVGASRDEIATEIEKIRADISRIPKTAPPSTPLNKNEISRIHDRLEKFSEQLVRIESSQSSTSSAAVNSTEGYKELKADVLEIKNAIQEFNSRTGEERNIEIERVEVDLSSVEQQLGDLYQLVESLKSQPGSAEQQHKLTSVLSSIGVLTARMTELSQVVTANILPAEKFDAKLDRLTELYRDVTNRLEHMFKEQRPDTVVVDELRREMRSMHDQLSEMSQRPAPVAISLSPGGPVVVKSRLSPALVAATIFSVLSLGVAATAALMDNRSDVSSASTTQPSFAVQTSTSSATINEPTTTSISTTSTPTSDSTTSSMLTTDEDALVAGGAAVSSATEPTVKRSQPGGVIAQPSKPVTTVSVSPVKTTTAPTTPPTTIAALATIAISEVAIGAKHSCVLSTSGSIYCWGNNDAGQLGQSSFSASFSATALKVEGLRSRIKKIVAGRFHTCGLDVEGIVYCWGSNGTGQIGNDSTAGIVATPALVAGEIRFSNISAGAGSTCGLSIDKTAYCWGRNADNELGSKVGYSSEVPVAVSGGWIFDQVVTGEKALSCGIEESGRILCWGEGDDYYGPGEVTLFNSTYLGAVFGVGSDHMCAVPNGRDLRCYSNYSNDVTGVGSTDSRNPPGRTKATLPEPLVSLSLGFHETCGLTADGKAYCWGSFPTLVNTTQRFVSLDLFGSRKCGVTAQASLYCWGTDADGRSSSGTVTSIPTVVTVKARG